MITLLKINGYFCNMKKLLKHKINNFIAPTPREDRRNRNLAITVIVITSIALSTDIQSDFIKGALVAINVGAILQAIYSQFKIHK